MDLVSAAPAPPITPVFTPERGAPSQIQEPPPDRSLAIGFVLTLIFVFLVPGFGLLAAIAEIIEGHVTFGDIAMLAVGWVLTGLGVTVGYHRLLTHRSFETYPAIRLVLLILGSMAVEGPAVAWV